MPNPGEGLVIWRGPYTAIVSIPGHGKLEAVAGRAYEFPLETCAILLAQGSYWEAGNEETKKYVPPAPPFMGAPALLGEDGTVGGPSGSPVANVGRPILYNKYGLRRFRAAAGDAFYKPVPVICVGDSITAGIGGNNLTTTLEVPPDNESGWVGQLRQLLSGSALSGLQNPGEGLLFNGKSKYEQRIGETGANSSYWVCTPLHEGFRLIGSAETVTITIPAGVTSIGVIQANMPKAFNEAGTKLADTTAKYKLGAGAETALTTLTNTGLPIETKIACEEGELLTIFGPTGGPQSYIVGFMLYAGTKNGFFVHRIGIPGDVAGDLLGGQKEGVLRQAASAENQLYAIRSTYGWSATKGLIILSLGTNDQHGQAETGGTEGTEEHQKVTLPKYEEWMKQYVNQAVADGWCVLILGEPRSPTEPTGEGIKSMDEYMAAMKSFALATEHVSFMDVGEMWGTPTASHALGLTNGSSVHPLRNGHGDIARMVYRAILGGAPVGIAEVASA